MLAGQARSDALLPPVRRPPSMIFHALAPSIEGENESRMSCVDIDRSRAER